MSIINSITVCEGRGLSLAREEIAAIQAYGDTAAIVLRSGVKLQCTVVDLQRAGLQVWDRPPITEGNGLQPHEITLRRSS